MGRPQEGDSRQKWWPRPCVLTCFSELGEAGAPGTPFLLGYLAGQGNLDQEDGASEWDLASQGPVPGLGVPGDS